MIQKVKITEIFSNPNNPRSIRKDKFEKLVKSIKEFPEMLQLRPIVVNSDMNIIGGNMRFKACEELGLKEVYIIKAENLTDNQVQQFVIKDNVGFGEWDWDILANAWDNKELTNWGIDLWQIDKHQDLDKVNSGDENDEWVGMPEFETKDDTLKIIVHFSNELDRQKYAEQYKMEFVKKQLGAWITHYPYEGRNDLSSLKYE